jgi:hypothetical protein
VGTQSKPAPQGCQSQLVSSPCVHAQSSGALGWLMQAAGGSLGNEREIASESGAFETMQGHDI